MYAPPGGPYGVPMGMPMPMPMPMHMPMPPPYYRPPVPYPGPSGPPPPPAIVHLGAPVPPMPPPTSETITRAPQSAEERLAATVYVGKLPPGLDDDFVRRILGLFGRVLLWRRQLQDTGAPLGFGFADYENPECVARVLKVLNGHRLADRDLLVKMPTAEAQSALDAYLARKSVPGVGAEEEARLKSKIRELVQLRERGELPAVGAGTATEVASVAAGEAPAENKDRIVSAQIRMFRETTARFEKEKRATLPPADAAKEKEREAERKERVKRREAREREREKERVARMQEERDMRDRERRVEEREREKEQRKKEEEESVGPRTQRERERRRRDREREEKDDFDDRRREEVEQHARDNPQANAPLRFGAPVSASPPSPVVAPLSPNAALASSAGAINLSLATVARKRTTGTIPAASAAPAQGFSLEEEQAQWVPRKKRELVKLDGTGTGSGIPSAADLAALAEKVPTTRETLYAWTIDWAAFDEADLLEKRLRPWIVKKVIEYVSEEDPILRDFILTKLRQHTPPAELETQLVDVLDQDASPFVQKLWRLLAFELLRLGTTK